MISINWLWFLRIVDFFLEYLLSLQNIETLVIWLWISNEDLGSHSFFTKTLESENN